MSHYIPQVKTYLTTFIALLVLTILTVVVSRFDFGALNFVIAIGLAFIKASLVALFFMGLRWDNGSSAIALTGSLFFLMVFIVLTFTDVAYRDIRDNTEMEKFGYKSPVKMIEPGSTHNESHSSGSRH